VALKYDPLKASAPRVLAKGADYVAQRILEAARKHRVPTTLVQGVQGGRRYPAEAVPRGGAASGARFPEEW